MIEAKRVFTGQRKRYGEYIREWEIHTDCTEKQAVDWCFDHLGIERVPSFEDWQKERKREDGSLKYSVFFAGYYIIQKKPWGFLFTIRMPYAD